MWFIFHPPIFLVVRWLFVFLQETFVIQDCIRYDDALSDKSSNYSYNGLSSLTHSTDHYEAVRTSTSNFYSPIYVDETLPTDFEISVEVNGTFTGSSHQEMLTFGTNHPITYSGTSEIGIVSSGARYGLFKRINGSFTAYTTTASISRNTWYKFIVKCVGSSVTAIILDSNDNVLHNNTQTINEAQSYKKWNLIVGDISYTLKWKNLKIKAL